MNLTFVLIIYYFKIKYFSDVGKVELGKTINYFLLYNSIKFILPLNKLKKKKNYVQNFLDQQH